MQIEIPKVLQVYNKMKLDGPMQIFGLMGINPGPKDCVGCGSCASHCPQGINIPEIMQELADQLKKMPGPGGPFAPPPPPKP
jgi:predicted aldo/keto reductase-like oxidoreductase